MQSVARSRSEPQALFLRSHKPLSPATTSCACDMSAKIEENAPPPTLAALLALRPKEQTH